jgi:hypothetical protein
VNEFVDSLNPHPEGSPEWYLWPFVEEWHRDLYYNDPRVASVMDQCGSTMQDWYDADRDRLIDDARD